MKQATPQNLTRSLGYNNISLGVFGLSPWDVKEGGHTREMNVFPSYRTPFLGPQSHFQYKRCNIAQRISSGLQVSTLFLESEDALTAPFLQKSYFLCHERRGCEPGQPESKGEDAPETR
jgi:hypothetical protein